MRKRTSFVHEIPALDDRGGENGEWERAVFDVEFRCGMKDYFLSLPPSFLSFLILISLPSHLFCN